MRYYLRAQIQGRHTIDRLEDIKTWKEEILDGPFRKDERVYRQSDTHWYRFECKFGKMHEKRGGTHMDPPEYVDSIIN